MNAAIYARKSTAQEGVADEQKSVTRQTEMARAYAAQYERAKGAQMPLVKQWMDYIEGRRR